MSISLLVTRPNHDHATNYLCCWSTYVIKEAEKKRIDVYDLDGNKANKKTFDSYLVSKNPKIIFLNGHGDKNNLTGYNNEILLQIGGKQILNGNIIYARSCDAAVNLGRELISRGAKVFIGYNRKFNVVYTLSKIFKPLEDFLAKQFLEPSNLVVTTIIKGNSVEDSDRRSKDAMRKNFRKMLSSNASYEETFAAPYLWSNIKGQIVYGDIRAKI